MNIAKKHSSEDEKSQQLFDQAAIDQARQKDRQFLDTNPNIITGTNHELVDKAGHKIHVTEKQFQKMKPQQHQQMKQQQQIKPQQQQQQMKQQKDTLIQPHQQHRLIGTVPHHVHMHTIPSVFHSIADRCENLSYDQYNMLSKINGKVLTRDPKTLQFKFAATPLFHPNSRFAVDINRPQQMDTSNITAPKDASLPPMNHEDYLRYHQARFKNICQELRSVHVLSPYTVTKSERCFQEMRTNWFKIMKIVCDSYANFVCDDTQCFNSPLCPRSAAKDTFCGIKAPKQQQKPWKSWALTPKIVKESIYDSAAIHSLQCATNPTPLTLSLRHDYRAEKFSAGNTTVVTLEGLLQWVKSKYMNPLIKSKNKALSNRVKSYMTGNTMCFQTFCPHYSCPQQQQKDQSTTKTNNKACDKQFIERLYNQLTQSPSNAKTYFAVNSLSPIDRWLCLTFCAQQMKKMNNKNPDESWDIRKQHNLFLDDLRSGLKSVSSFFTRADSAYDRACNHHTHVCESLNKRQRRAYTLKNCSLPALAYFSNPSLVHHIQQLVANKGFLMGMVNTIASAGNTLKLNPLPALFNQWNELRAQNRLFCAQQQYRSHKWMKCADARKLKQIPVDQWFEQDSKGRKVSKLITPTQLQKAKSQLRAVYPITKHSFDSISHWDLGHIRESMTEAEVSFGKKIHNFFSKLKRKISQ